ncbi:PilN domain-containing protein [Neobacillus drentensis]|uniref:PilN domain-containing protein n=1 Tax=Neobacillus drentensis TaxID=220684 RepID=UPI00285D2F08|nr:PilN domain-containing protein [Neobacillus drentensis]MDR7237402.1 Tfp pilus assembly protein PilN [Neobacillus drentensis]
MLVEINLLPQKEPKKIGFIITLSSLVALLLIVGAFYLWQTNAVKSTIASLDRQISMTKKIAEKENKSTEAVEVASSVNQLKSAIEWANEYPIQTIPVMRDLTSLLPERGFIKSFAYTEAGTISLSVQFDSAREAAYFLDNLNESKWIEEASLSSLTATVTAESTAANSTSATTSQSNTTNTSNNSTTQTTNQTNQTNQNDASNQNSTAITNGQTKSTTGTTGEQTTTSATTSNTNTVSNSTTASNSKTSKNKNDNILPRYTGQFEIKLNKEVVKKNINKSKKNEEGVTAS